MVTPSALPLFLRINFTGERVLEIFEYIPAELAKLLSKLDYDNACSVFRAYSSNTLAN